MSEMTAQRMMQVADRFGTKSNILLDLKPAILYALAAPSTPEPVVEKALEKAEAGDKVTLAEIQEWKAKAADLELALKEQTETIDFFKQQALCRVSRSVKYCPDCPCLQDRRVAPYLYKNATA